LAVYCVLFFFFQAEDGIRDIGVTGVQTCALPICAAARATGRSSPSTSGIGSATTPSGSARSSRSTAWGTRPRPRSTSAPVAPSAWCCATRPWSSCRPAQHRKGHPRPGRTVCCAGVPRGLPVLRHRQPTRNTGRGRWTQDSNDDAVLGEPLLRVDRAAGHAAAVDLVVQVRAGGLALVADLGDLVSRVHRSEEHTSELQSRQYLVCRLLLEKKKLS